MAQATDFTIANQSFPSFRTDLNSVLSAINTMNSGTSRPSSAVAGTMWLDTTSASSPTIKFFDGTDDISFATIDYSANTVNFLDSTVVAELVSDTTPQLGGNLDTNSHNIAFDDAHGINDENGNEQIIFQTTGSAVNQFDITNAATGNAPEISATGGDTNIDFKLTPKGTGKLVLDGIKFPNADGTSGQALQTDGSGNLSFATIGGGSSDFFFASKTSNQSIPNNTKTKVTFTSEDFDTGSDFASSTYTVPSDGKYFFYTKLLCDNSSGDTAKIYFYKNGSQFVEHRNSSHGANRRTYSMSAILDLSASDTIEVYKFQDGGSARDVDGDSNRSTFFTGYKIA